MGMVHSESPSLHTILEESTNESDMTSSTGESSGFPISQGVQCGDTNCPHHNHTPVERHFGASDHPDGPTVDHCTIAKQWAPS
jgi:hypothetical protein